MSEAPESLRGPEEASAAAAQAERPGGVEAVAEAELAAHLEELPGGQGKWALWKCVGLRGAGFPAEGVLRLGGGESARAAAELLDAEEKAEQAWEVALGAVNEALEALPRKADGSGEDARVRPLLKARRSLKRGKPPQVYDGATVEGQAIREFAEASARIDDAHAEFVRCFETAQAEAGRVLREVAADDRFREAVTWQNRRALHSGIDSLLRRAADTATWKRRASEELIASYVQRYCVKNDSIGFFGPVGWARLDPGCPDIHVRPGPSLLAAREVYFECWGIDALCRRLEEDERLRPWFVPRRLPSVGVEGRVLHMPLQQSRQLDVARTLVLAACDGEKTAQSIARELVAGHPETLHDEAEVYRLLAELEQMRLVVWRLEVPDDPHSEVLLRALLERVADVEARTRALGLLDRLEGVRREVAAAAGDAQRLDGALARMEESFTEVTRQGATRHAGQLYAARTLLYEDCRRDVEVTVGREMLERLGDALGLLLDSARWLVAEIGTQYRRELNRLYLQLARGSGTAAVEATTFWLHAAPLLGGKESELVEAAGLRFQEKWARVLPLDAEARRLRFDSADLRALVATEFAAPKVGWEYARYHSPDVMVAAESVEAIRRGDYEFVLGEVHVGKNTLGGLAALMQHPQPEELYRAFDADMTLPGVVPVYPKDEQGPIRTKPALEAPKDFYLLHNGGAPGVPADRALTTAMLVVEASGPDLFVRTRDGRLRFDIIEFFGDILSAMGVNKFKLFGPREHTPRVSIDRLVVQRESWSVAASSIAFAFERDEAVRFLDAHRFARERGIPRHAFFKVPVERKPVYVDFGSPVYVNLLSKLIRRSAEEEGGGEAPVVFSEMLPGVGEVWLPDAEGARYTSEFRFVALDLTT